MAIHSRPASEAPATVIERLAEMADIAIPGDEDTGRNRLADAGALAGIGMLAHPAPVTRTGRGPPCPPGALPQPGGPLAIALGQQPVGERGFPGLAPHDG